MRAGGGGEARMREQWSGRRRSRAADQADVEGVTTQQEASLVPEQRQGQENAGAAGLARVGEDGGAAAETVGETGVLTQRAQQALQLAAMLDQAQDYARLSRATNTQRAYRADWADFSAWCAAQGLPALPACGPASSGPKAPPSTARPLPSPLTCAAWSVPCRRRVL